MAAPPESRRVQLRISQWVWRCRRIVTLGLSAFCSPVHLPHMVQQPQDYTINKLHTTPTPSAAPWPPPLPPMELSKVSKDEMLHLCSWSNNLFEPFGYLDSTHNTAQTQASSKFSPRTTSVFSLSSNSLPTSTTTFSSPIWNPFLSATGAVLSCLRSYLSNRHQFIITSSCTSSTTPLSPGIPSYHHSSPLLLKLWSMLSSRQELTAGAAFYSLSIASSEVPNSNTSRALLFAGRPPLHLRPHHPVLQNLHWASLLFKVPLLTYKVHHNQAFLTDLLHRHTPSHGLCFSDANLLSPLLRTRHRTCGNRAFCP